MFDCGHKSQYMGVQREKFVRYNYSIFSVTVFLSEEAFFRIVFILIGNISYSLDQKKKKKNAYSAYLLLILFIEFPFALTWFTNCERKGALHRGIYCTFSNKEITIFCSENVNLKMTANKFLKIVLNCT